VGLTFDHVTFRYRRRPVLHDVSWSVGEGVTALLGPNGSGKTTLLKCAVGLLKPDGGRVVIDSSHDSSRADVLRHVGYVPQSTRLPGLGRVEDLIGYAAWLSGISDRELARHVEHALEKLDLRDLRQRRVRTLSGGQRQRVAIATGMVHRPRFLFLDEPTAGLDPGQRLKVRQLIKDIGDTCSVVLSTHLTEDVQHLARSVGVLVEGQIRFSGTLDRLIAGVQGGGRSTTPGSSFEQAYEGLMATLGAHEQ